MKLWHVLTTIYVGGVLIDLLLEAKAFGFDIQAMARSTPNPFLRSLTWPAHVAVDLKAAAA